MEIGDRDARVDISTASRLERDLNGKPDAAVMVRLRLKGEEGEDVGSEGIKEGGQASVTLVCCHLWFDPVRPDLKTAQCQLLFDAIGRFHEKNGVVGGNGGGSGGGINEGAPGRVTLGGKGSVGEDRGRREEPMQGVISGSLDPANLILCGDFNSVPVVNPHFLPGPLKVNTRDGEPACSRYLVTCIVTFCTVLLL